MLEGIGELAFVDALLQQPEQQPRVDRARTGRHYQALKWCEAHRRVDRAPVADRCERGPGAEVAGYEAQVGAFQQLGGASRGVRVREAVEAEPPKAEASAPARRQSVGCRRLGNRGVKGGVEAGDRREGRERLADRVERGDGLRLVKGSESDEPAQGPLDLGVDQNRVPKALATVDDPVPDGVRRPELVHGRGHCRRDRPRRGSRASRGRRSVRLRRAAAA